MRGPTLLSNTRRTIRVRSYVMSCHVSAARAAGVCKRDPSFISRKVNGTVPSHIMAALTTGTCTLALLRTVVDLPYSNVVDPDLV